MPNNMKYTAFFNGCKTDKCSGENAIIQISARNTDCGPEEAVLTGTDNLCLSA